MDDERITAFFSEDHDHLDRSFEKFRSLKRSNFAEAEVSFDDFKLGLERHIAWEEDLLFPLFEKKTGMTNGGPTEAMKQEHRQIRSLLEDVHEKVGRRDPESDREEQSLGDVLEQHNHKEEHILYPAIDRLLSEEERRNVFEKMNVAPIVELDERCREVVEKTEWIAITTSSAAGPHTVAAWGYRLRKVGIRDGLIVLPAGRYLQTENNLKKDPRIHLLIASSEAQRADGKKGQGYRISGRGEICLEGALAGLVKAEFPWARGALVVRIERTEALIS